MAVPLTESQRLAAKESRLGARNQQKFLNKSQGPGGTLGQQGREIAARKEAFRKSGGASEMSTAEERAARYTEAAAAQAAADAQLIEGLGPNATPEQIEAARAKAGGTKGLAGEIAREDVQGAVAAGAQIDQEEREIAAAKQAKLAAGLKIAGDVVGLASTVIGGPAAGAIVKGATSLVKGMLNTNADLDPNETQG